MDDISTICFITAQVIGLVAIIVDMLSFQKNSKNELLKLQIASNFLFAVQYMFLGAFSGALINVVCMARNYLFRKFKKIPFYLLLIVLVAFVVFTVVTYDGPESLLPLFAMSIYTLALYTGNTTKIRLAEINGCILMIIYHVMVLAIFGTIATALVMASTIVAMVRYRGGKKPAREK